MLKTSSFVGETNIGNKVSQLYSTFNVEIIKLESKNDDSKSDNDKSVFGLSFINKNNKQKYYKLFNLNDCDNIKKNTELGMIKTDKFINIILYSLSKANSKNSISFKEINNHLNINITYETDFFTVSIDLRIPAKLSDTEILKTEITTLKAYYKATKSELDALKLNQQKTENELKETKDELNVLKEKLQKTENELNTLKEEFKLFVKGFSDDKKVESKYVTTWSPKFKGDLTLSDNNTKAYSNRDSQWIRAIDDIPKGKISIWKFITWFPYGNSYFFGVYKCDGNTNFKIYPNVTNQYGIDDGSQCIYYGKRKSVNWNKPKIKVGCKNAIKIMADYTDNKQLKLTFYYMNKKMTPPDSDCTMILPAITNKYKWYPACVLQNKGVWCKISFFD